MSDVLIELREMRKGWERTAPSCDLDTLDKAIAEIERLSSFEFKGLGLQNWTCPHCRKQSDIGPFSVRMNL